MDLPDKQEVEASAPDPPPYSEKEPYNQQLPPAFGPANPAMSFQYQPYYGPYSSVPSQGPVLQPPLDTTTVVPVQPTHEPDYLAYSIFTLIFCFTPLGVAALVFSILTREANNMGNGATAQRKSRMARILAHSALGVGLVLIIVYIVILLTVFGF